MPQFLLSVIREADFDHATLPPEARAEIDALNNAMVEAGVRVFVGGLQPLATAITIPDPNRSPSPRYLDGLWVIEAPDLEAAAEWGHRAARACRAEIEVRPFY